VLLDSCLLTLADAGQHLQAAENLLLRPAPGTLTEAIRRLDASCKGLSKLDGILQNRSQILSQPDQASVRQRVFEFQKRVSRVERMLVEAGKFYREWGQRLQSELGYTPSGQMASIEELVKQRAGKLNCEG
jgi:hypothetical protein